MSLRKRLSFMPSAKRLKLIFVASALCLSACKNTLPVTEGSVLVIAVSGINADDIGDGNLADNITPNIEKLVKESIRFTHAYTTSPLENAAFASLFTGLYPSEHGVRTNGAGVYNKAVVGIAETLSRKNYMTFLLSGGPPLLRKSAISKGFRDFDDTFKPENNYFMPSAELSEKFLNIFENRIEHTKFFGVLYFPDFLFQDGTSKEKRLQELDASIGKIRDRLEKLKKWDGLTVVFTSLRGNGRFEALYDDVVRVPLIIKPSRAHRDLAPSWKLDYGITFADLGMTLHSLLGIELPLKSQFDVMDFSSYLYAKNTVNDERTLWVESDLLKWRHWGPRVFALRQGEWVYFPIEKKLYNTYTDRSQINNLFNKDKDVTAKMEKIWWRHRDFLTKDSSDEKAPGIFEKLEVAKVFFSPLSSATDKKTAFEDYSSSHKDWQVTQWYLRILNEKKSDDLKKIVVKLNPTEKSERREVAMWKKMYGLANKTYAASDCEAALPLVKTHSLEKYSTNFLKECRDHETQAWLHAYLNYKAKRIKEALALYEVAQAMSNKRKDLEILGKYFWANNATWDLETSYPQGLPVFEFFLTQLGAGDFDNFVKKKPNL